MTSPQWNSPLSQALDIDDDDATEMVKVVPEPETKSKEKEKVEQAEMCKCGKDLNVDDDCEYAFIKCKECKLLFHLYCTNLPPYELYKYLKKTSPRKYVCEECVVSSHKLECDVINKQLQLSHTQTITTSTTPEAPQAELKFKREIEIKKEMIEKLMDSIRDLKEEVNNRKKEEKRTAGLMNDNEERRKELEEKVKQLTQENRDQDNTIQFLMEESKRADQDKRLYTIERRELLKSLEEYGNEMKIYEEEIRKMKEEKVIEMARWNEKLLEMKKTQKDESNESREEPKTNKLEKAMVEMEKTQKDGSYETREEPKTGKAEKARADETTSEIKNMLEDITKRLTAIEENRKEPTQQPMRRQQERRQERPKVQCYACHKFGHIARNCYSRRNWYNPRPQYHQQDYRQNYRRPPYNQDVDEFRTTRIDTEPPHTRNPRYVTVNQLRNPDSLNNLPQTHQQYIMKTPYNNSYMPPNDARTSDNVTQTRF